MQRAKSRHEIVQLSHLHSGRVLRKPPIRHEMRNQHQNDDRRQNRNREGSEDLVE